MGFDSKREFAPPTVLLGLLLCPWAWGISPQLLQCCAATAPVPTILLWFLWPWMWGTCSWLLQQSAAVTPDLGHGAFIPIPKKGNAKKGSNYRTIAFTSYANEVILKILQARPQQYMNHELPDVQAGFRKGRGTRDQIANICWIIRKKQESSRKTSSALLTMPKPLTV